MEKIDSIETIETIEGLESDPELMIKYTNDTVNMILNSLKKHNKDQDMKLNEYNAHLLLLNNRIGALENKIDNQNKNINKLIKINRMLIEKLEVSENNVDNVENIEVPKNNTKIMEDQKALEINENKMEIIEGDVSNVLHIKPEDIIKMEKETKGGNKKRSTKPRIDIWFKNQYYDGEYRQKYFLENEEVYNKISEEDDYKSVVEQKSEIRLKNYEYKKVWIEIKNDKKIKAEIVKDRDDNWNK